MHPSRGEVWIVDLEPVRGHETGRTRPALIVSADRLNHGPAGLVVVLPVTSVEKRIPLHVRIDAPEGGVRTTSWIKCEEPRCIAKERLLERWGSLSGAAMSEVEFRLRTLLDL